MRRVGGGAAVCSMGEEPGNASVCWRKGSSMDSGEAKRPGLFANVLYVFCGTETNCMTWRGNKALTKAKTHMQPCEAAPKSFQTLWLGYHLLWAQEVSFITLICDCDINFYFEFFRTGRTRHYLYLAASTKSFHEAGNAKSYWAVDGDW